MISIWSDVVFNNYSNFSGRATRGEFWWFTLANIIISFIVGIVIGLVAVMMGLPALAYLTWVFGLAILLPSIALAVRRLHDTGRSGWWYLFGLVPIIGTITLLVFYCLKGDPEENEYGEPAWEG